MYRLAAGDRWEKTDSVFVLTTGRTGTNTLAELLDIYPCIDAYHEPHPNLLKERQAAFHEVYTNPDKYARIFARARAGLMARSSLRNTLYAETSPRLTFFAPVISQLCPNARFIHLVRHPGDVVRSGMRRKWYEKKGRSERYRIIPSRDDPFHQEWETASAFEKNCWQWNAYNSFALRFRSTVPNERVLLLRAEDLFHGKTSTLQQLFDFLGVECPSQNLLDKVLNVKMNRQTEGLFPAYDEWADHQYDRLFSIAGDTMAKLGYSISR